MWPKVHMHTESIQKRLGPSQILANIVIAMHDVIVQGLIHV